MVRENENRLEDRGSVHPFAVRDCALVALATGKKARQLSELRHALVDVDPGSIYHHFWGELMQPRFEEREYNNDFASWVRHDVHDGVLAERLAALDPLRFPDLEALRRAIVELIDARLDERDSLLWGRATRPFELIRSRIVVFDTGRSVSRPEHLPEVVESLSIGSVFYHFVDARRRTAERRDDFSEWLCAWGDEHGALREALEALDPYFGSLGELRMQLSRTCSAYFERRES